MAAKGLPGEPVVRPFPDSSYTTPFREGFGDTCKVGLLALDHQLPFLSSPDVRVTWMKRASPLQWRDRSGFAPDSLLPLARRKSTLLVFMNDIAFIITPLRKKCPCL